MNGADTTPGTWPVELRYSKSAKTLTVVYDDGAAFDLAAELLRVESPSAEVMGHAPDEKKTVPGRRHVGIMELEPVGHYAVRIKFDDLHETGIYTWPYLRELGEHQDEIWTRYEAALEKKGLSRDP